MPNQSISIIADSTISLPHSLVDALPLFIVPFEVHHKGQVYTDGVDLPVSDFYTMLRNADTLPTTSAPRPGAFLQAFQQASLTSQQIICLTLSARLSAAHQSALTAKNEAIGTLPGLEIHVIDSRSAGPAVGLVALDAARKALSGAGIDRILRDINQLIDQVHLIAYLETLYYVWKGGRVPKVTMWLSNLLKVKPILQFSSGSIAMIERARTRQRAIARLVTLVEHKLGVHPGRVAVMHAGAPDQAEDLAQQINKRVSPVELIMAEFTPVIGAHTGPGLVGCAFHPLIDHDDSNLV